MARRRWSSAARSSATSGSSRWTDPFIASVTRLTPPEESEARMRAGAAVLAEAPQRRRLRRICWHAPTVRLLAARPRLRGRRRRATPIRTGPTTRWAALPGAVDPGMFLAGQDNRADLGRPGDRAGRAAAAQAEFRERTGGGVGGSEWVAPAPAGRFRPAGGPALAGIRHHGAGRGMVLPDAARGDGRGAAALTFCKRFRPIRLCSRGGGGPLRVPLASSGTAWHEALACAGVASIGCRHGLGL